MKGLAYIALGLVAITGFVGKLAASSVVSGYPNWSMPGQQLHVPGLKVALASGAVRRPLRSRSTARWLPPSFVRISIARFSAPQFAIVGSSIKAPAKLDASAQNQYSASELFSRVIDRRAWQADHLDRFSMVRTYKVENDEGKTLAEEVVVMEYKTPGTKTFKTTSANGSAFIRSHVFRQLMEREAGRARGRHDGDSSIAPDNYVFEILGQERIGSSVCTVVHAAPKRKETYLFEGKIWIDDQDFAIVKATGHLAKSPSLWIKRVDFIRQYQKIEGFWFPIREQSTANVRIYGTEILTVDYVNYTVNGAATVEAIDTNSADGTLERGGRDTASLGLK